MWLAIFYYEVNVIFSTFLQMEYNSEMLDKINIIYKIITYNVIELFIPKVKILIFIFFHPFTQEAVILKHLNIKEM